jgi:uncharacterized delta-60 repeat protein
MININSALSSLNSNYSSVTDVVPDLFYFSDEPEVSELGINYSNSIAVQNDGKLIIGGALGTDQRGAWTNSFFNTIEPGVIRINADGTLDETFIAPNFSLFSNVLSVTIQPADGKIVVGGYFSVEYDAKTYDGIIRLNNDGSVDDTFNSGFTSLFSNYVNRVIAVSDGIIVYGALNNEYNGVTVNTLTKLNTDGTLNTEFNDNFVNLSLSYNFDDAADIEVLSNGKILVSYSNYYSDAFLLKINANGTEDETWTTDLVFTNTDITYFHEDANNNIFCAGDGAASDGVNNYYYIVKLNSDGTVDNTFIYPDTTLPAPTVILSIDTQPDGKVLIGGWFYSYGSQYKRYIQRLNSDGSLDETFSSPYSFDGAIFDIKYLGQNEIWVAGAFSKPYKSIVKLNRYGQPLTTGLPIQNNSFGIKDGGNDLYDWGSFFNTDAHDYQGMGPIPYNTLKEGGILEQPPFGGDEIGYNFYAIPSTHTQSSVFYASNYDPTSDYGWTYNPNVLDSSVKSGSDYFGVGSQYFTQMYPGMFVLIATNVTIDEFSITGGTGVFLPFPSSQASVSADVFSISSNGQTYTCFLKSVYGKVTGNPYDDPSINHIIIVPGSADGITHLYDETSVWDDHCLQGLTGRKEIYYLMLSRGNNVALSSQDAQLAAQRFMDLIGTTVTLCTPITCNVGGLPCQLTTSCACPKSRLFAPGCSLSQSNSNACSTNNSAYVPAITVCRQRLF